MIRLTPVMRKFILHWGEMGTRWGVNRTVAQIHALLYLSREPLHAEQIAHTLSIARSNVSNSLRELQSWRIVRVVQKMGDRRDYFESMKDVWEMFRIILDERRKRETEPTLALLRECVAAAEQARAEDGYAKERIQEMLGFFETMTSWYLKIRNLPTGAVVKFAKLGDQVRRLAGLAS